MSETDAQVLTFIADRLVYVYDESPNVDFVQRLRKMAREAEKRQPAFDLAQAAVDCRDAKITASTLFEKVDDYKKEVGVQ